MTTTPQEETPITIAVKPKSARMLRIGLIVIAISFFMSGIAALEGVWAGGEEAVGHHDNAVWWAAWAAYLYAASWVVLGGGILIGGKPAYEIFKSYRQRLLNRLLWKK